MNPSTTDLLVGGFTRLSTCDWPGELAATVFCQGCLWDCPYCHNPELRSGKTEYPVSWSSVLEFLQRRKGLLDAVVFSGGEPLLQPAILNAVVEVRSLGFRIGLHTTGMFQERFAALLPHLDWVGFDIKAPRSCYVRISGVECSGERAFASLYALVSSRIPYEARTTLHSALISAEEMLLLEDELLREGVTHFVVQHFRAQGTRTERLPAKNMPLKLPANYGDRFVQFQVR